METGDDGDGDAGDGDGDPGDGDAGDGDGDPGDGDGDGDGDAGDGDPGDGDGDAGDGDGDGDGDGAISCGDSFMLAPEAGPTPCTVALDPQFTTTYVFIEIAGQQIDMIAPADCMSADGFYATGPGLEAQPWCTTLHHEGIIFCGSACSDFLVETSAELLTSCPAC